MDRILEKRLRPSGHGIGFRAEVKGDEATTTDTDRLYEHTHPDDLRHFCLIPEPRTPRPASQRSDPAAG